MEKRRLDRTPRHRSSNSFERKITHILTENRNRLERESIPNIMLSLLRKVRDLHDGPNDPEEKKVHEYKYKRKEPIYTLNNGDLKIKLAIYVEGISAKNLKAWIKDVYHKAGHQNRYNIKNFIEYTPGQDEIIIINQNRRLKTYLNSHNNPTIMIWGKLLNNLLEYALQAPNRSTDDTSESEEHSDSSENFEDNIYTEERIIETLKAYLPDYRSTFELPRGENINTYQFEHSPIEQYDDYEGISGYREIKHKYYVFPDRDMDGQTFSEQVYPTIQSLFYKINLEKDLEYKFQRHNIIVKTPDFDEENDLIECNGQFFDTGLYEYSDWTVVIWGETADILLEELLQQPNREAAQNQLAIVNNNVNPNPPQVVVDLDLYDSEEAKNEISRNNVDKAEEERRLQQEQERYERTRRVYAELNTQKRNLWEKLRRESQEDLLDTREKRKEIESKNADLQEKIKRLKTQLEENDDDARNNSFGQ